MNGLIPTFDPETGALPPGDHQATLEEIGSRLGFTPRRRWLLKGLRAAFEAFWNAGIEEIYIDGFCPEKPETGDVDGYWVEADLEVYDRVDPYWIDFTPVFVGTAGKCRSRMSADHGVEFFIHPAGHAGGSLSGVLSARSRGAASRRGPSNEVGGAMIKSDAQRERTVAQIEGFRRALAKVAEEKPGKRSAAICGSYEGMVRQLEEELREYDN